MILREALSKIANNYDYIIIDCPPSLNIISLMCLTASNSVIVPVQAHYLALEGIAQLTETINLIKQRLNSNLEIGGVLVTLYDPRKLLNKDVFESLNSVFKDKVYKTTISNNIALAEAPSFGKDIFLYKPKSKGALQYEAFVKEFLEREKP